MRVRRVALSMVAAAMLGSMACAQIAPEGAPAEPVSKDADPIKIVKPTVDKKNSSVSIPAAFWNQRMTNWVEVAVCGRPSDFLHETIVSVTTTKDIMEKAMREAGFRDADAWVKSVRDFPRVRGDRVLVTLTVTRKDKAGTPVETYSLDELLEFQGWGVPAGPYGWMFKGDPEREVNGKAAEAVDEKVEDRTKILRDDPQVALVFKGLQHQSQSYADHPLAYDDWIYPMMRYNRNLKVLPEEIYNSNGFLERPAPKGAKLGGDIVSRRNYDTGKDELVQLIKLPVTLTLKKVTEEQFVTESAGVWHDAAAAKYIREQLPVAKQIDKDKGELWGLLEELKKLQAAAVEVRDVVKEEETVGKLKVLAAKIEKGYATLDAAWAKWAADHPVFDTKDNEMLEELKLQVKRWREHMELLQKRAEQLAVAEEAGWEIKELQKGPQNDATAGKIQRLEGKKLEASSSAMLAEDTQPREYWKWEQGRITADDPRTSWKATINAQVELLEARKAVALSGLVLGRALQNAGAGQIGPARMVYRNHGGAWARAELKLKLVNVNFEIEKREMFPEDADLPRLRKQKEAIEAELAKISIPATTQPGM